MAITIGDDGVMTGGGSGHTARWSPDAAANGEGAWICSRLPGRLLTERQAEAALTLAELESARRGGTEPAAALRAELGI